jgi:hypothetical protein
MAARRGPARPHLDEHASFDQLEQRPKRHEELDVASVCTPPLSRGFRVLGNVDVDRGRDSSPRPSGYEAPNGYSVWPICRDFLQPK